MSDDSTTAHVRARTAMNPHFARANVAAIALTTALLLALVLGGTPSAAVTGAPVTLPDLVIRVPTDLISIGVDPTSGHRELRFTHMTADVGAGPFEIDPSYDSSTGTASFSQEIYNNPSPGVWQPDHSVPVAATGVWDPPSDYNFPLTKFTLDRVNADGSLGAVVATSPKTDYCITGDYRLAGVANTPDQTFIPQSNCTDPTQPLGWSVGWADQYDQTDAGQPIDLTGVADGTYVLRAVVDPLRVLTESDTANDVTDTRLQITGTSVTVLSQTNPSVTPPPGGGHSQSVLRLRSLRWRHGVLTVAVTGLPKGARLSVELEFAHRRPRFLSTNGARLRVRTRRPKLIVLRVFAGRRQVGKAITAALGQAATVRIINPVAKQTLSGTVPIFATASGDVSSVQFLLDGRRLGRPVTRPPFVIHWNTTRARSGRHRLSVVATDRSGNRAKTTVIVTVQNPAPPMTCFVLQAHVSAHGLGAATTSALHTAMARETLLAFVSADGPAGAGQQTAAVSGGGLTWRLVKRANASPGDSEIWAATAPTILTGAQITSVLAKPGFDESISVIAMEGAKGVGSAARASGRDGAGHLELTTSSATSLVFAVGHDWSRAGAPALPTGWVALDEWLDARAGDTFWSQYTNQPTGRAGTRVAVDVAVPASDQWNLAAVELVNSGD